MRRDAIDARRIGLTSRQILPFLDHVLASVLLLVVSSFWLGRPLWWAAKSLILLVGIFAAAYLACAIVLAWMRPQAGRKGFALTLVCGLAAFGLAFMALKFAEWRWSEQFEGELPHAAAFAMSGLGMALLLASNLARDTIARKFPFFVPMVLLAALAVAWYAVVRRAEPSPAEEVAYLDSSLHVLKTTTYRKWIGDGGWRGGAIAAFDDGYVVASGRGAFYFVTEKDDGKSLAVRPLDYAVPFNPDEFSRAGHAAFGTEWTDEHHGERLRVADLLVQARAGGVYRLFVSHHFWKTPEKCYVVRVSMMEGSRSELLDAGELAWRTVYESAPCLALNVGGHRGGRFGGYQIGGAMALLGEDELLVAVGDHEFDGWNRVPPLPQDPASPYGKLMRVALDTGNSEVYSLGHRNPQGLFLDASGRLWATEHGPRGGDELNLVRRGANYGWPLVTYGTEYWLHHWPLNEAAGRHDGFEKPILSFVPSVALSSVTGVAGNLFPAWRDDLLLVSLKGDLKRVRIDDGRAVVVEPFLIGGRIRDIAQGRNGKFAMWTDGQALIFLEPADSDSPEALAFQCAGCHTFSKWERASIGPNLWKVVGRGVASAGGFEYSQAMKDFGGRWTRERLDRFLADPAGTVPGTTMQFDGIKDPAEREKLIQYLKEQR